MQVLLENQYSSAITNEEHANTTTGLYKINEKITGPALPIVALVQSLRINKSCTCSPKDRTDCYGGAESTKKHQICSNSLTGII